MLNMVAFPPPIWLCLFLFQGKFPPEWRDAPGRFAAQIVSPFVPLWKKMPPERRDAHGRLVPQNCLFLRPERRDAPGLQFIPSLVSFLPLGSLLQSGLVPLEMLIPD